MSDSPVVPSTERLLALVEEMAGRPILVLADLVADRFIHGTPKRISREAPVLILRHESESFTPGGGANAITNIAALGGEPLPLGVVGDDESGRRLLELLGESGIVTDGIAMRKGYRTPTKTRILGGGRHSSKQQIVRYDIEESVELSERDHELFARQLEAWEGRARIAVLSDYGYGAVQPALLPSLRKTLDGAGTVICDSRYRLGDFRGLDGATPNEEEAESLLGAALGEDPASVGKAGERLRRALGARFVLITRGSYGMCLVDEAGTSTLAVHGGDQVADVTGAGDTVIGTFALALAAGGSALEAALLADYAGGVVVMKAGTATLGAGELQEAVSADPEPLRSLRWERS